MGATVSDPLDCLLADFARIGVSVDAALQAYLQQESRVVTYAQDDLMARQLTIADRWWFVAEGVVASRQTHVDGDTSIARFFEAGQLCANLTSAWTQQYASDDLIAMTNVVAIEWPDRVFRSGFLEGDGLGSYLRLKMMETLCFDKEIISAKTLLDTEVRYRFLEQHYGEVVTRVRKRDIAAFLGITPQGLSRFLRHRVT